MRYEAVEYEAGRRTVHATFNSRRRAEDFVARLAASRGQWDLWITKRRVDGTYALCERACMGIVRATFYVSPLPEVRRLDF